MSVTDTAADPQPTTGRSADEAEVDALLPLCYPHFVPEGKSAFDLFEWNERDARIAQGRDAVFEQTGMEFPAGWSDVAVGIVAQKYARGGLGTPERETSLRQIVSRVVDSITEWGVHDGYFNPTESRIFQAELAWLITSQRASFNSPVWFNIGVPGAPQQASACFILSIEDDMNSILNWYTEEGCIFRNGSGAGVNVSPLRGSMEKLSSGGSASGPVSFMRGADASAGAIKSGGRTRRSAKMVLIDDNHPDVLEFIHCKVAEEAKARALAAAGWDMSLHSDDAASIGFRNANHSVRLSDGFMKAVRKGETWNLRSRVDGTVTDTVDAKELLRNIAEAAHACGDPGVQFSDTINRWHTCPNAGPINASNPCSEYMHIDDSACNLASVNMLPFLTFEEGTPVFDVEGFVHACTVMFVAQDILVTHADYPTEKIGTNARNYRELGLGFTNLGAMLMSMGLAYDSSEARLVAGGVTALMSGAAYATSARMATKLGPFAGYEGDKDACVNVITMHRSELDKVIERHEGFAGDKRLSLMADVLPAAVRYWDDAVEAVQPGAPGIRNSQATLLAPTGTISFMMDADTTGVEPDFALVKRKQLVGGGFLETVNQSVGAALQTLGYDDNQTSQALDWLTQHGDFGPADGKSSPITDDHLPVFACAVGHEAISPLGHMKMIAACQPFLSGAISKTVNLPVACTVEEIEELYDKAWDYGIKAIAVYRDGSKATQPLAAKSSAAPGEQALAAAPVRRKMPRRRNAVITSYRVGYLKGYLKIGEYDDGSPGEVFMDAAKEGTPFSGALDALGIVFSYALQYGAPLEALVQALKGMQFEPQGLTDDPDIRFATSVPDFIVRRLALDYLPPDALERLGISSVRDNIVANESVDAKQQTMFMIDASAAKELCVRCGWSMHRAGTCWACPNCGETSGCS